MVRWEQQAGGLRADVVRAPIEQLGRTHGGVVETPGLRARKRAAALFFNRSRSIGPLRVFLCCAGRPPCAGELCTNFSYRSSR